MLMKTIFIYKQNYANQCQCDKQRYDKPLKNRHASADICAASLEYSM